MPNLKGEGGEHGNFSNLLSYFEAIAKESEKFCLRKGVRDEFQLTRIFLGPSKTRAGSSV
jgi:hypothetical protein